MGFELANKSSRIAFLLAGLLLAGLGNAKGADKSAQSVLLSQYPSLSQKDPENYRDQALLTVRDTLSDGTGTELVPNLACAATVYTMLERGRGNQQAAIDDFYPDPRKFNGNSPGANRPTYVGGDVPLNAQSITTALQSGQPVVLHGYGGTLQEHFVLAVGCKIDAEGMQTITALDPYPGSSVAKPAKQIELRVGAESIVHPLYNGIVFRQMRMVTGTKTADNSNSNPPADAEVIATPIAYQTYTFVPGKLTGKKFWMENIEKKEKMLWREFSFEPFLTYKRPEETVSVRLSLRGGYRAHDLFGHDDFEPKETQNVATGWVPHSSGHFLIYPDQSKEHLPKWVPERTKLIRVPFIKQYGATAVNAYDLALGLDRVSTGKLKTIEFQLIPTTDDNARKCVRLVPAVSLTDGVYIAYSLPDGADTAIYGFLFAVGSPGSGGATLQSGQGQTPFQPNICLLPDVQLARDVLDYALLSEAVYAEKTVPNWELLVTDTCPINGMVCWKNVEETSFQVQVYRRGNKLAIAFRGTELTASGDWKADVWNFFGGVPKQYEQAVDFVQQVIDKAGSDYDIVLTGHSLGGGLASYAALRVGTKAVVFNAAGLGNGLKGNIPKENLEKQKALIRNIDLTGDPVSGFGGQVGEIYALKVPASLIGRIGSFVDNRGQMVGPIYALHPEAAGEAHAVSINPLDYHFIAPLIETLEALAK